MNNLTTTTKMKPQLTTAERHEVYKKALEKIKSGKYRFICLAIKYSLPNEDQCLIDYIDIEFPELYTFKPKDKSSDDAWWPSDDRSTRIRVLQDCIDQTAPNQIVTD